jgi:hypothetical protein
MHVHIHGVRRQFQEQERRGISARHQQAAKTLLQCVAERPVADPSAIDEQVLKLGRPPVAGRVADEAAKAHRPLTSVDLVSAVGDLLAKKESQPLEQTGSGGHLENELAVVSQDHVQTRIGEGQPGNSLADVTDFRRDGPQEFPPHGRVVEQVISAPSAASLGRDCNVTCATPPIDASASPRKPSVAIWNSWSAFVSLLVA